MMSKTIVFPTDFSTLGHEALEYATQLAREQGSRLLIVHVQEPAIAYGAGDYYYGLPEPDTEAVKQMLAKVKPTDPAVAYEHRLLMGEPAESIVELAQREHADLIILGSHGRTGLARLLLGSVTEAIMRRAACPVMVIKSRAQVNRPKSVESAS